MELLISQKNKVFDLVEKYGFSPNEFEWRAKKSGLGKKIYANVVYYKNSNYYFIFNSSDIKGERFVEYSPGNNKVVDYISQDYSYKFINGYRDDKVEYDEDLSTFKEQSVICEEWLGYLKREVECNDKWEQLLGEEKYFKSGLDEKENSKFSYEEVRQIENSVSQLKEGVIKLGLKESEKQEINQKLDYLVKKSKTLGRIDWKNIAIGTFMGMIGQLSLQYPKEIVAAFVEIIKASFKVILLLN